MLLIFPFIFLTCWVYPLPAISDDRLTNLPLLAVDTVSHFLSPKDQIALYGTHSTIKGVLKEQFLEKAKALNQTCPRWLIRKAFGNVWSIFTKINDDDLSLSCLELMNNNLDMIREIKTLDLMLYNVTTNYLDALGKLLSNKEFTLVRIFNFEKTFPVNHFFEMFRYARVETLKLVISESIPSRSAFENLALNENIKNLQLESIQLPLFLDSFKNFPNLLSIDCRKMNGPLNQTLITNLNQFNSLSSIYLNYQTIRDQEKLLSIDSPFKSFAITIVGTENSRIEKSLKHLKLYLHCSDCRIVVLELENSYNTLETLEIKENSCADAFKTSFLSTFFKHSTALVSLTLFINHPSQLLDLLPFSVDLKTLSLTFWNEFEKDVGPIIEFISTQENLEHFHLKSYHIISYEDAETLLVRTFKALQSRNHLKTINFEFEMGITADEMTDFVSVFMVNVSGFMDKDVLINGVRVKDIIERMKVDEVPKDIVRSSKVWFSY